MNSIRKKAAAVSIALLLLIGLWLLRFRTHEVQPKRGSSPVPDVVRQPSSNTNPWEIAFRKQSTNALLRALSTNNVAFQEWGTNFILAAVNEHLSKVPLFGLQKKSLSAEDVLVFTFLTLDGADIDLATKDLKHVFYYSHGGLTDAIALGAEMTGIFRDPVIFEHLGDNAGPWTKGEAAKAAKALVRAKGLDLRGSRGPFVRPDTFDLPMADGSIKPVTVFYTVNWLTGDDTDVYVRFRRTASGAWDPTKWFDLSSTGSDKGATSYANLYARFFLTNTMPSDAEKTVEGE
jgi:hypothetical protein